MTVGALGERLLVEVLEGVRVVLLQLVALDLALDHPVEGIRRLEGRRVLSSFIDVPSDSSGLNTGNGTILNAFESI